MTRTLRFASLLFFCLFVHEFARAATVELQPGQGISSLKPHLSYYSDPAASLGEILTRFRAGGFGPDLDASMLDWNYAPEAWAAVEIDNATLDDGRGADPFVLTVDLPLVSELDAYVIRESGFTENLINYSIFDPFVPEDHSVTRLRTPVFGIAPQEKIILLVNFKFGPFQSFGMALETPVELEASAFASGITHTAFYAFSISCLIFFFGFNLAMKNWIGLLYALQFAIGLAFIAYTDGLWFRFSFPDDPQLQSPVGFFLLFALSGVGFVISGRSIVQEGRETRLSRALTALGLLSVIGFAISLYSPGTYSALFGYVLLALMFVAVFVASGIWRRFKGEVYISSTLISAFATLCGLALIAIMIIGSRAEIIPVATTVKGVFGVLLIATMTGLTTHIIALRRQHSQAVVAELAALEAEARRSQELLVAERNYTRARDLASVRQRQLATASHDLKQPIVSLRMNVDALAADLEPQVRARLNEAFDYMEALSDDYLRQTSPDPENGSMEGAPQDGDAIRSSPAVVRDGAGDGAGDAAQPEPYEIALVLNTVHQMFNEEAISKGLRLRCVPSTLKVSVPPLVVMRIVSNLVSNAVKYTEKGSILIGVRNRGRSLMLCVFDTGPGMDDAELSDFSQAYRKGDASRGHGLGLSVCFELSKDNGMDLGCRSLKAAGTAFSLTIPLWCDNSSPRPS